ncbi:hypothetical protein VP01_4998g1, partial [Puccinia sorghi]
LVIQDHATIAMYSQTCKLLRSLENSLIKISSFLQTQLIQVISLRSQIIKGRNSLTIRILISINILHSRFSSLRELRNQIQNFKKMKDTIKWIISCVILHNLLADPKDKWNELYEEDETDSAPVTSMKVATIPTPPDRLTDAPRAPSPQNSPAAPRGTLTPPEAPPTSSDFPSGPWRPQRPHHHPNSPVAPRGLL